MLGPQDSVTPPELDRGVRYLMADAAFATAVGALNSGVVLLALALHLGASNIQIGLLAAIPLLTQVLQAPAVLLVERLRTRRRISVTVLTIARLALPVYALVPFIPDRQMGIAVLSFAALVHYGFNAIGACSWNSWIRDLIPGDRLGAFFARRSLYATAVGAIGTGAAAIAIQIGEASQAAGDRVFAALYGFGFLCGLASTLSLAQVPEPRMVSPRAREPLPAMLWKPLKDRNFRNMLRFIASWQFAVNLATPFFTVYFVRGLGFPMSFVLLLTLISQIATFSVLRGWGRLSDRFANKSVLLVATPVFLTCIAAMIFADEFASHTGAGVYLIIVHIIMGMASAGVGLASGNIAMKLSPPAAATSYMATNALVGAIAAGIAPIIGGNISEFFAERALELRLEWRSPAGVLDVSLVATHWEFFFLLSALIGLYTLHRLSVIEEAGAVERGEIVQQMWTATRRSVRGMSPVAGLRLSLSFPGGELLKSRERSSRGPPASGA